MEKSKIEWCDSTWNPISGCYHTCPYCYARGTANRFKGCDVSPDGTAPADIITLKERLTVTSKAGVVRNAAYPYGFTPTLHEYRLDEPKTCKEAPGHRYLFLTKNPRRYVTLAMDGKLPKGDMFWYGSTVTGPEVGAFYGGGYKTFVSIEPILEPFDSHGPGGIADTADWAIFGAETGNRKDKVVPERSWIEDAVKAFKDRGKPVFITDSMKPVWGADLLTEFPWEI